MFLFSFERRFWGAADGTNPIIRQILEQDVRIVVNIPAYGADEAFAAVGFRLIQRRLIGRRVLGGRTLQNVVVIGVRHRPADGFVASRDDLRQIHGMRRRFRPADHLAQEPAAGVFLDDRDALRQDPVADVVKLVGVAPGIEPQGPDDRAGGILGQNGNGKDTGLLNALVAVIIMIHADCNDHRRRVRHLDHRIDNTGGWLFLAFYSNRIQPVRQAA